MGDLFGGGGDKESTQTVVNEMSPEQKAALKLRQDLLTNFLQPYANKVGGYNPTATPVSGGGFSGGGSGGFTPSPESVEPYTTIIADWSDAGPVYTTVPNPLYNPGGMGSMGGGGGVSVAPGMPDPALGIQYFGSGYSPYRIPEGANTYLDMMKGYVPDAMAFLKSNPYDYDPASGLYVNPSLNLAMDKYGRMPTVEAPTSPYVDLGYSVDPTTYEGIDMPNELLFGEDGNRGRATAEKAGMVDPGAAQAAAKAILQNIAGPGVMAQLSSSGQGRSGAETEAISHEAMKMALPIAQQVLSENAQSDRLNAQLGTSASISNAQIDAQKTQVAYLQTVASRLQAQALSAQSKQEADRINAQLATVKAQLDQATNQLNATMKLTAAQTNAGYEAAGTMAAGDLAQKVGMTGPQYGLTALGMMPGVMETGFNAAMAPQNMEIEEYNREMNFLLALLGGTPIPGGGTSTSETTMDDGSGGFDMGSLMSMAGMAAMMYGTGS